VQCERDWPELQRREHPQVTAWSAGQAERIEECVLISHNWDQIRRLMWNYVGIVRSEKRLSLVRKRMQPILAEVAQHFRDYLLTPDLIELRNLALVAELIVKSAMIRKESRGLHYMLEYPVRDDVHWRKDTVLQK
jgi:L-aspartate oxidase